MKFYNREQELKLLNYTREETNSGSKLTVITGRRRVGKTKLVLKSLENTNFLYFFVARKSERLLCEEYVSEVKNIYGFPIYGEIKNFKDLFLLLMEASKSQKINLIIDEFQEFERINPSIYSEIQNIWDRLKDSTQMNLIVSGSVYSVMKRLFENAKEPLFGRANERLMLQPFNIKSLKTILSDIQQDYSNYDLLSFYCITGGLPKYVEIFADKKISTLNDMLDEIFRANSYLLEEGKNTLVEEFGKEYTTYFSILALIASSKTSRNEIESILEKGIGGYLEKLETDYNIIQKVTPILSKPQGKNRKYKINDRFLRFWFRFIYKYRSAIEIGNFDYVKKITQRDFSTFLGEGLESYFKEKLSLSGEYSEIGSYWEKGNKNEIDIVAINEIEKKVLIGEVKLNKEKISLPLLIEKAAGLRKHLKEYEIEYKGFSVEDM